VNGAIQYGVVGQRYGTGLEDKGDGGQFDLAGFALGF